MPWHETDPVNERVKFVAAHQSGLYSMSELCQRASISRPTGYKWLARYAESGVDGLKDRSHAPKHCPQRMAKEVFDALLAARRAHPHWGPRKLLSWLGAKRPELELPAASTYGDLLVREGLVEPRRRRTRAKHPGADRLVTESPNEVWTVDFKGEFRMQDRRYCYPLTVADAHTRFLLGCDALFSTAAGGAQPCFVRLFSEYGLPWAIRTDNGSPFASTARCGLSRLNVWWLKLGIVHQRIKPASPQQNAIHERMHRTLKAETTRPPGRDQATQQALFDSFRAEFNTERPHEALEQKPPASLYYASTRSMPSVLPEPEYPGHYERRHVRHTGCFRFRGGEIFLSEVLASEWIGLEETDNGIWSVYFFDRLLARFDERTCTLSG
jgi:transposase InsO family protein